MSYFSHGDISLAGLPHVDKIPTPVQEILEGTSHEEKVLYVTYGK